MSTINIADRFRRARALKREKYTELETNKRGNLRAGSSGVMSESGDIAGTCHRKHYLRSIGIEADPPTADKHIMFELGYANEDQIYQKLQATLGEGEVILREEEIPIEWHTSERIDPITGEIIPGTKVTGRPDIVICKEDKVGSSRIEQTISGPLHIKDYNHTPILGLELKSVHSLWSARDVIFGEARKPKMDNLIQAAHYMWKLGCPYKIIYTGYSQLGQGMAGNEWIIKQFPSPGERGSEFIEYSIAKKSGKATIKHVKQFEIVFDLRFNPSGRLEYREEGSESSWVSTIITTADIERYFEKVSEMGSAEWLGPRPHTIDVHGKVAGYDTCNYCPLKPVCTANESKGRTPWLQAVKEFVENKPKVPDPDSDK